MNSVTAMAAEGTSAASRGVAAVLADVQGGRLGRGSTRVLCRIVMDAFQLGVDTRAAGAGRVNASRELPDGIRPLRDDGAGVRVEDVPQALPHVRAVPLTRGLVGRHADTRNVRANTYGFAAHE